MKGIQVHALSKEALNNSFEKRHVEGIQLKRRVNALFKSQKKHQRNAIKTARRRAIQKWMKNSSQTAHRRAFPITNRTQLKPRVAALFQQRIKEFNWNCASTRYSHNALGNSVETALWRNSIENGTSKESNGTTRDSNNSGIQMKRRVDARFKRSTQEFNWNGASTRYSKTHH